MFKNIIVALFITILTLNTQAQDIPIGTWRTHFAYNKAKTGVVYKNKVFVVCELGLFSYDTLSGVYKKYTKDDGLSGYEISKLAYDTKNNCLIILHNDGKIDLLKNDQFTNILSFYKYDFSGSKLTNSILVKEGIAYLSTDAGLLVLDVAKQTINETYYNIGPNAKGVSVNSAIFQNDSLFIATNMGVLGAKFSQSVNLKDFQNWQLFNSDASNKSASSIIEYKNVLYSIMDYKIYHRDGSGFIYDSLLNRYHTNGLFGIINYKDYLNINYIDQSVIYNSDKNPGSRFSGTNIKDVYVNEDKLYVFSGDSGLGIWNNKDSKFIYKYPSSPRFNLTSRLRFFENKLYVAPGRLAPISVTFLDDPGFYFFDNYNWTNVKLNTGGNNALKSIFDFHIKNDTIIMAAFNGVIKMNKNTLLGTLYNATNSTLRPPGGSGDFFIMSSLAEDSKGNVFCTQGFQDEGYNSFYKVSPVAGNQYVGYTQDKDNGRLTRHIMIDDNDYKWLTPCDFLFDSKPFYGKGITVYNDNYTSKYKVLTADAGKGKLTSNKVNWSCKTLNGEIWLATNNGISVIDDPTSIFKNSYIPDSRVPVYDSRALLRNKIVNVITVDAANRKWITTENEGVWLFSVNGDSLISRFTTENSSLPSNIVYDIAINPENGEVYFATEKGLVSYRGDATEANTEEMKLKVKVFPNPVVASYSGSIGISGLAENAIVKITDVTGKLVYETKANGGMATWNACDYNGRRVDSGVYVVFSATVEGQIGIVTKIVVMN